MSMSSQTRIFPALAGALLLAAPMVCAPGAAAQAPLAERIEAVVPEAFSGQIVLASVDGVLYVGHFGLADREDEVAVTDDTLFDIGSVTKTFTATAVLKLAADDELALEQTLGDWFDGLEEATAGITVHQLLTHTSGLPQYSGDDIEPCDRACLDDWLASVSPEFPPGERYSYSNPGYSALARIVEKASGQDYETYLVEELASPLKLGPIGYLRLPADRPVAVGYFEGERVGRPPELDWMEDGPSWHLRGNGGLLASANTLSRWLSAIATGRVLPPDWQAKQLKPWVERQAGVAYYGYGWVILERPWGQVVDHTGGNGFFFADARWLRGPGLLLAITNNAFEREQIQQLLNDIRFVLGLGAPE
jgi:CubicO group peptidase (beta-lactamase class C family)